MTEKQRLEAKTKWIADLSGKVLIDSRAVAGRLGSHGDQIKRLIHGQTVGKSAVTGKEAS